MLIVSKLDKIIENKMMSVDDLIELTGLTRMTIYNARKGNGVSLHTAVSIANALNVTVDEIWQSCEDDIQEEVA